MAVAVPQYMKDHIYQMMIMAALTAKPLALQGVRKIIQPFDWQFKRLPAVTFEDLGYGSNKLKQLQRNYWNDEELDRVSTVLKKRAGKSFTSVAVSLRNKAKDSRSMGHCMLSLVVSRSKGFESVEIQYRSTELGLKFSGDLAFLPTLLERLGCHPDVFRFRFANCFLSGVYFPYIGAYWDGGPESFLREVRDRDLPFFKQSTRFFLRSAYTRNQVFPYSPENVAHKFGWSHLSTKQMNRVRDFLEHEHKKYGKPLPTTHYKPGEYVPRGQRNKEEDDE